VVLARATSLLKLLGLCVVAGVLLAALAFPAAGGLGWASNQAANAVQRTSVDLATVDPPLLTRIQDKDGNDIAYLYVQDRVWVEFDQIADTMKAAILAIEDRRFYEHRGVDWQGTMRALVKNQIHGEITGGGSSLTQQYVKNYLAFVAAGDDVEAAYKAATEQTAARKLREIQVALELERKLSKDEILTRYLNTVPFNNQIFGVAEAARAYFGTTADKLTITQAALLAGMVNAPSIYDPYNHPDKALERRNLVIEEMWEAGMLSSDPQEARRIADEAKAQPLGVLPQPNLRRNGCVSAGPVNGFFCAYVISYLERAGLSVNELKRGGYTIRTTMDSEATRIAKEAAEKYVPKTTPGIANAMAIVEPGKDRHRVVALAANRDYGNKASEGQTSYELPSDIVKFGAGSIYKIFTTAAAMEQKNFGINHTVAVPETYTSPIYKNGTKPYTVRNSGSYGGSMTIQQALAHSPNTPFIWLEEQAGLDNVVDMAYRLGLRESMQGVNLSGQRLKADGSNGPSAADAVKRGKMGSFTLGVGATSVLELANVSATLMSGGVWCQPTPIEEVLDRHGKPVRIEEPPCEQAVSPELANSLVQGLSRDHVEGTAKSAAQSIGWTRPMMGKTGTTQDHKSAGFVGATPQYAGAVLTFSDAPSPRPICKGNPPRLCNGGDGIFGGSIPAPTWFYAMQQIHEGLPVAELPPADPRYS